MSSSKTTFGVHEPRQTPIHTPQTQHRAAAMRVRPLVLAVRLTFSTGLLATLGWAPVTHAQADSALSAQDQAENTRHYDLPAGPLSTVLTQFSTEAGIFLVGATDLAQGKSSPGVHGEFSAQAALNHLLSGAGLQAQPNAQGQYVLQESGGVTTLPPVKVTARLYGSKETTSMGESSASVGLVTSEDIDYGMMQYLPQSLRRLANVEKGATNNTGIVIRGMNFEGFSPAGAPMGSIYVDGILQSRYNSRFGARGLWDAEQVEVYRGPQTTLSGRAATAGAVYLKTKDPTFEKEWELSSTVGNKSLNGGAFIVNAPVSVENGIALRIAGAFEEVETEISYPNYRGYDNYDEFRTELSGSLRAKLLFEPEELQGTRAMLTYSYSKDRPNERLADPGPGNRGDFYQFPTFAEFREIDVHNLGLEVTRGITPELQLTSQTSVSHGVTERESVDNGTPDIPNAFYGTYDDTLYSQELRLNYDDGLWAWVLGVFGSYEDQDSEFFARLTEWSLEQEQFYYRETTNFAVFGETTYEFAPSWKFTLGGRIDYLKEKTDETSVLAIIGFGSTTNSNSADIDEVNVVPKVGVSKEIAQDHVAGFTFSQGFRTGGFYLDQGTGEVVDYDPEYANNYEFHYKGRFLEERLSLTANVFYTQYKDQQVETYADPGVPTGTIVSNAASSNALGFELEPTLDVNENLSVFASVGYLRTDFDNFYHSIYGDLSGESFPEASEWTVAFGGLYKFQNGVYIGGDAKYLSDYTARFSTNPPLDQMDSRFLVNMQAGIRRENWEANLFAENLFDEDYYTMTELDGTPAFAQVGPSRLYGINFKAKF